MTNNQVNEILTCKEKEKLADELKESSKRKITRRYSEAPDIGKKRASRRVSFAPTASLRYVAKIPDPVFDKDAQNNTDTLDNHIDNNTTSSENTSAVPHFIFDQSLKNSTSTVFGEEQIKTTGSFGTDESPMSKAELNEESCNSVVLAALLDSPCLTSPSRNTPLIPETLLERSRFQKNSYTSPVASFNFPDNYLPPKMPTTSFIPESSTVEHPKDSLEALIANENFDAQSANLNIPLNNNSSQNMKVDADCEISISPLDAPNHTFPNLDLKKDSLPACEPPADSENKIETPGSIDISSQTSATPWSFPVYEDSYISRQLPFGNNPSETAVFFDPVDNQPPNVFLDGLLKSGIPQLNSFEKNTSTFHNDSVSNVGQNLEKENEEFFPTNIDGKEPEDLVDSFFSFEQISTYSGGNTTKHTLKTGEVFQNFNSSDFENSSSPTIEKHLPAEIVDCDDIQSDKKLKDDLTCIETSFHSGAKDTAVLPPVSQIDITSMSSVREPLIELESIYIEPQTLSPEPSFFTSRADENTNNLNECPAHDKQRISNPNFDKLKLFSETHLTHFDKPQLKNDAENNLQSSLDSGQTQLENNLNSGHVLLNQLPNSINQSQFQTNKYGTSNDAIKVLQLPNSPTFNVQNRIRGSLSKIQSHTAHNSPINKNDRRNQRFSLPCHFEKHDMLTISPSANRFISKPSPRLKEAIQRIITPTSKSKGHLDSIRISPGETLDISEDFFVPSFNSSSENISSHETRLIPCPNKFKVLEFLNLAGVTFLDSVSLPCRKSSNSQEFIHPASPHTKILSRFIWAPQAIVYRSACQKSESLIQETTNKVSQLENSIDISPSPTIFEYVNLSSSGQRKIEEKLKQLQAAFRCEARYSWFVRMNELGRSLKNRWSHDINSCRDDLYVLESKKEIFCNIFSDSLKYSKSLEFKLQNLRKMLHETESDKNDKMLMLNNSIEEQSHAVAQLQSLLESKQTERKELTERLANLTNNISLQSKNTEALKSKCSSMTPITIEQVSSSKDQFELISEFGLWRFDLISSPPKLFLSNTSVFNLSLLSSTCLIDLSTVGVEPLSTSTLNDPIHTFISSYLFYLQKTYENISLKKFCFEFSRFWNRSYCLLNQVSMILLEFQAQLKFPDFKPNGLDKTVMQLQVDFNNHMDLKPIYFTLGFDVTLRMLTELNSSFPRWGYKSHYGLFGKSMVDDVFESKVAKSQDSLSQLYLLCKSLKKEIMVTL